MKEFAYRVITEDELFVAVGLDELLSKYKQVGTGIVKQLNAELIGQPTLEGLLGPFCDGMVGDLPVIRYESQKVYDYFISQ